ncbi:MAG: cytochrome c oxidase subunit II [Proteobacteria bacterium]|nr:cytochrome c oxidase subunit II [Pseudomonadota bacterium]
MAVAVILLIIVVGSVVFNFVSPWWFTPIASNWSGIDDALIITFWICGAVFIAIGLFMVLAVYKYHSRPGLKADYEPENKRLEYWLTGLTTIGVVGMLAPGLIVWGEYVTVPENAVEVEVLTQQWSWSYRFPGEDGKLGTVAIKNVNFDNPFGMNPDDPNGQDDVLVSSQELHLLIDQPVKVLLRSKDVLHNFYVPQFRAKMDIVPGMVTYLWLTPIRTGTFPVLCAELCGIGHHAMRGTVVVNEQADFDRWLASHPTYAMVLAGKKAEPLLDPQVALGRQLAEQQGCFACHSLDGSQLVGPTWQGLWGRTEVLTDGTEVIVDADYVRESIAEPNAKVVQGFAALMLAYQFTDEQLDALIAYLEYATSPKQEASAEDLAEQGRQIIAAQGCSACHSLDGTVGIGPSWQGLFGRQTTFTDGSTIIVDEAYIRESILNPMAKIVDGFAPIMIPYQLDDEELAAIVAFTQSGI